MSKLNKAKMKSLNIACWNVRTLLDEPDGTPRRTAMLANTLAAYNVDIAALSETRREGVGELRELAQGYSIFWKGYAEGEPRRDGVGWAIRTTLYDRLNDVALNHISERLSTLRFSLKGGRYATLIAVYAPTMTNEEDVKEAFYEELNLLIKSVPTTDKLIILGDFNARVGRDTKIWNKVIGRHGLGTANSNGRLLLSLCADNHLVISNTTFDLPDIHKGTWMHPRSKIWHTIDYVITRQRDRRDISLARAYRGADCETDHKLIRAKVSFIIEPAHRCKAKAQNKSKKLNVKSLRDPAISQQLKQALDNIEVRDIDVETCWTDIKTQTFQVAMDTLGPKKSVQADWFDENEHIIQPLIDKKNKAHVEWLNNRSSTLCMDELAKAKRELQRETRRVKDEWFLAKAQQIQTFADSQDAKAFHAAINEVYGPTSSGIAPIRSKDGSKLLTKKKEISDRWKEHFHELLNCPSSVDESAIEQLEQLPIMHELDIEPCLDEVQQAIKQTRTGKAPGVDGIPAEVYRHGGIQIAKQLLKLYKVIWNTELVPQDLKDASIVTIYKRKGDKSDCGNHRGISLLSIAGKILARILLNRLLGHIVDRVQTESQCGFRANRGTTDMIFVGRQIQEKCREQHRDLFIMFIDLTKAFDTVNREALWKILSKCGCPEKFINIIRQLHDGMAGSVTIQGETTESFGITNGVKQGCVLAPTLFGLFFAVMIKGVVNEIDRTTKDGILIRFRKDGRIFHLSDLKSKGKTRTELVNELLYADDCALLSHTEAGLQRSANLLAAACKKFGLTISIKKTEVMFQPKKKPTKEEPRVEPQIKIGECKLNVVNQFTYLGSIMSDDCTIDREIEARIKKASSSFGRLHDRVWSNSSLRAKTKIAVYKAIVLTTLLYGCETWTCHRKHVKALDSFHHRRLRYIQKIKWQDLVPNTEVLSRSGVPGIESFLFSHRLRWAGHVMRMDDNRLPKKIMLSELEQQGGKTGREVGRPLLRYKDTLKDTLKKCQLPLESLDEQNQSKYHHPEQDQVKKRQIWRTTIQNGVRLFEKERVEQLIKKRADRKERQQRRTGHQYQQQHQQHQQYQQHQQQASASFINQTRLQQQPNNEVPPTNPAEADVDLQYVCQHCAALGVFVAFDSSNKLRLHSRTSNRHKNL